MGKQFIWACLAVMALAGQVLAGPKVAMVLPGSDTDKGWNQMAREGLEVIKKDLGAQTKIVTNVKEADFYARVSDFAEDGYDVVICHGGEFEKVAQTAAKKYPKTHFIVGGCPNDIPGAVSVDFLTGDASKLVGVVAGDVSVSRKVAFVGAEAVETLKACYDGMAAGVKISNKGVEVLPAQWTNSWDSPTLAREKTEAAMNAGADVIYQNVDAAALGVFQAVQDANKNGKKISAFGCNSNQNDMAPDVILGSVVLNVQKTYLDTTRDVLSGKVKNGALKLGLMGGYVDLVLNDKHPLITPAIQEKVATLRKAWIEGAHLMK